MNYVFKLTCVSLAAFFLVHFVAALAVRLFTPPAIRVAEKMRARDAARFLLTVRFAPVCVALFVVAALCVPSFLRFEPDVDAEEVGWLCTIAAVLCAFAWAMALSRGLRALLKSRRVKIKTLALAGVIRPRVIVTEEVARALSPEQFDAALSHERAHAVSRDNLKRLMLLLAPDAWLFGRIEEAWKKFAEWTADDRAAGGDAERSIALAGALVRVARIGASGQVSPLMSAFTDGDLAERVERLLNAGPQGDPDRWTPVAAGVAAIAFTAVLLTPGALISVYALLERLIR